MRETGITFPVLLDGGRTFSTLGMDTFPEGRLGNPDGVAVRKGVVTLDDPTRQSLVVEAERMRRRQ